MNRQSLGVLLLLIWMSACASIPMDYPRSESHAYRDTEKTQLGRNIRPLLQAHPGRSGFYLLSSGVDAFIARMLLVSRAERSIDLQYYLYHDDTSGHLLAARLLEAADRGVRVRVLLDDIDTVGKNQHLAILDQHENIQIRLFNPFAERENRYAEFVTRFGTVTRRMHNKAFIVDNQVAIVGGRNIGDEYFERNRELAFGDLDLLALGPVVADTSRAFDLYWNHPLALPVRALDSTASSGSLDELRAYLKSEREKQRSSEYRQKVESSTMLTQLRERRLPLYWARGEVLYDHPDKLVTSENDTSNHMFPKLHDTLKGIDKEIVIFSPYFVPTSEGVAMFRQLEQSGVQVRILTNSLAANDVPAVHAGYRRYREVLLKVGVELYELKPVQTDTRGPGGSGFSGSSQTSLHAKTIIVDRKRVFIGSLNIDPRSIRLNTEMGILLESEELGQDLVNWLQDNIDDISYKLQLVRTDTEDEASLLWIEHHNGKEVVHEREPKASLWRHLQVLFFSILPIEGQL